MRVVLDTNIVVSALLWNGIPKRLIQAAVNGDIDLLTSPVLIDELSEVLERQHLATRWAQKQTTVAQAIAFYKQFTLQVSPLATPRVVASDADDDHVLACAVAARADLIVTGDKKDLLPLQTYLGIPIVNAREAAQRIGI